MPAHRNTSPIRFYTDRYWTRQGVTATLHAPPSPSQLPRRQMKQRHRPRSIRSPIRPSRMAIDDDDDVLEPMRMAPVAAKPLERRRHLFDNDEDRSDDLGQRLLSRPRRPSRTLPSRIPSFMDVEKRCSESPPDRHPEALLAKKDERDMVRMQIDQGSERRIPPAVFADRRHPDRRSQSPRSPVQQYSTSHAKKDERDAVRMQTVRNPERRTQPIAFGDRRRSASARATMPRSHSPIPERPISESHRHETSAIVTVPMRDSLRRSTPWHDDPLLREPDVVHLRRRDPDLVQPRHDDRLRREPDMVQPRLQDRLRRESDLVQPRHDDRLRREPDLVQPRNIAQQVRISQSDTKPPPPTPTHLEHVPEGRRGDRDLVSNLLKELLDTEIRYVQDLKTLKELYLDPMVEMAEDAAVALISMEQTRICFLDPSEIIDVHTELMAQLSDALSERHTTAKQVSLFCALIQDAIDRMRWPYTNYLAMFASSAQLLSRLRLTVPSLNQILEEIRIETEREIGSLLILPVQRLPRYELFLDRIEQHTIGSRRVAKARRAITELVQGINTISAATSPLEKLQWEEFAGHINLVSATRTLIQTGDCRLLQENTAAFWTRNSRSTPAAAIILCNDVVVVAARISGGSLRAHTVIALRGARIADLTDDGDNYRNLVQLQGYNSSVVICCDTPADKSMWMTQLERAIEGANNAYEEEDPELLQLTIRIDLVQA